MGGFIPHHAGVIQSFLPIKKSSMPENSFGGAAGLTLRIAIGVVQYQILDPGVVVDETGALRLRREAGVIPAPHHFVELRGGDAEASAKGAAELLLGTISVAACDGA